MKRKTRILSMLLAIVMLFGVMAGVNLSAFAATSGDYEYVLLDDGTVAITGYNGNAAKLTIPSKIAGKTVTSINGGAFWKCTGLTSIAIPDSVISIGYAAFQECADLTSITIPNSVKSIYGCAFAWCPGLTNITIPNSVTEIGYSAFQGCTGLTSITIPNNVTSIEGSAFFDTGYYNNENNWENGVLYIGNHLIRAKDDIVKGNYTIKSGTVTIAEYAFQNCMGLTGVTIPSSVTSINYYAFSYTGITSIKIPNSVKSIGHCTFWNCTDLTSATIPNSVTSIGDWAFSDCTGLTSITIPNSVTSIGNYAFYSCTDLTSIAIWNASAKIENWAIHEETTIYGYPNSTAKTYAEKYGNKFVDITTVKPMAPTAKYAVNSDRTFTISWNAVLGADKYEIYSYNASTGTYKYVKTTTELSHKTGKAAFGTTYKYKIRAVNSANNAKSAYCTVTVVNNKYLPAPAGKFAVNSDRTLTISWAKVTGADQYEIYSYNASTGTYKYVKTTTELSHKTGKAAFGTTYKYKIRAVNSANNVKSGYCTVSAINLPAPTAKYAVNSDRTFTISWNKVTGADQYEIYSYNASTGTYKYVKTTTALSHKTGAAAFGTTYKYKIRAVNSANNVKSAYCTVSAVNNKKLTTPTAKVTVNTNGTFTISWGKVTGATKYEVYIFDSKLNDYRLSRTSTGTSITTGTASKGVTYKYKVRAVTSKDASATSDFSAVVTGKR